MSGLSGAAPDRCPRRAGFHRWSTARRWRRAWPTRRGSAGSPTAGFPRQADGDPGDTPHGRRPSRPASCARVILPGGQPAVPGQQRRGCHREDPGPPPPWDERGPAQRTGPSRRAPTAPGWRSGAALRPRAGPPKARRLSLGRRATPAPPARATSASADKRSSRAPSKPTITAPGRLPVTAGQLTDRVSGRHTTPEPDSGVYAVGQRAKRPEYIKVRGSSRWQTCTALEIWTCNGQSNQQWSWAYR